MSSTPAQVRAWRKRVRGTEPPQHGTFHAYNAYRCKCDECRAANARRARKQWAKQARAE